MAKRNHASVIDDGLNAGLKSVVTRQVVCSAEPTTFAEANATYALADVTMASADFTIANGDGGGNQSRKVTVAAKSAVPVDVTGTATHVALLDVTNSILKYVTTCTSQALTAGNTVNIPTWKAEIAAPA